MSIQSITRSPSLYTRDGLSRRLVPTVSRFRGSRFQRRVLQSHSGQRLTFLYGARHRFTHQCHEARTVLRIFDSAFGNFGQAAYVFARRLHTDDYFQQWCDSLPDLDSEDEHTRKYLEADLREHIPKRRR